MPSPVHILDDAITERLGLYREATLSLDAVVADVLKRLADLRNRRAAVPFFPQSEVRTRITGRLRVCYEDRRPWPAEPYVILDKPTNMAHQLYALPWDTGRPGRVTVPLTLSYIQSKRQEHPWQRVTVWADYAEQAFGFCWSHNTTDEAFLVRMAFLYVLAEDMIPGARLANECTSLRIPTGITFPALRRDRLTAAETLDFS